MEKDKLRNIIEALVFASGTPITVAQIREIIEGAGKKEIEDALEDLAHGLSDRVFFLKKVGGGYQFATRPEYSKYIGHLYENKLRSRLSRAALETLAIIAFKQPITKVEISAIRGVNSDGVIKNLLERKLITISGRDPGPGRALVFTTSKDFLHYFGINEIADLPRPKEIEELLADGEGGKLLGQISDEKVLENEESEHEDSNQ
jgi:segregation and condensation protein B